jgi:threonine/homoserine/homoserine lactone efflux protein
VLLARGYVVGRGASEKREKQMLIGLLKILIGGFCVGLASSVTVGPVAVLCIQRTLSKGYLSGIASGLGVAVADTSLAILAFSVFALIKSYIDEYSTIIQICGGAIVIIIGVFIFFQNPVPQIRKNRAGMRDLWQDFASMFGVTLANFVVIIPYILAFFTMFNIDISMSPDALSMSRLVQNMFVILGFLLGAMTWWLSITSLINIFRKRFRPRHMLTINHVAGIVISVLGLITLLSTIIK